MITEEERKSNRKLQKSIQIVLALLYFGTICVYLFAEFVLRSHPLFGSVVTALAVLTGLFLVVYIFGRTLGRLRVRKKKALTAVRCGYCKDEIDANKAMRCPSCGSTHHEECYQINQGCSTFACAHAAKAGGKVDGKAVE